MAARTDGRLRPWRLLVATLAATLWVATVLAASAIAEQPNSSLDDFVLKSDNDGWHIEEFRTRMTVFSQSGESGYQSQAGSVDGPGSEEALVIQPSGLVTLRQNRDVVHQIIVPVDIVSASSANSIDALSTASAVNEAVRVEWRTRVNLSDSLRFNSVVAGHIEEPWRSVQLGAGLEQSLADDNATIALSLDGVGDQFNNNLPDGSKQSKKFRGALALNLAFSQLLSPTTVFLANYGYTLQAGTLHNTWNSVPLSGGFVTPARRGGERFPDSRRRQAAAVELAQHLPVARSTLRGHYRYYFDDFGVRAHTGQASYHQYLGREWLARTHYRFYRQTSVDFFATSFPQTVPAAAFLPGAPFEDRWLPAIDQTSDSDLAAFNASEAGVGLTWLSDSDSSVDFSYAYYVRSNGLGLHILSVGYGAAF